MTIHSPFNPVTVNPSAELDRLGDEIAQILEEDEAGIRS